MYSTECAPFVSLPSSKEKEEKLVKDMVLGCIFHARRPVSQKRTIVPTQEKHKTTEKVSQVSMYRKREKGVDETTLPETRAN